MTINKSSSIAKNRNENGQTKYIMIEGSTKNQKARTIKLSTDAIKVLKLIYKENNPSSGDEKIAITRTGKQNTTTNLEKRMETIYRDAGLGTIMISLANSKGQEERFFEIFGDNPLKLSILPTKASWGRYKYNNIIRINANDVTAADQIATVVRNAVAAIKNIE